MILLDTNVLIYGFDPGSLHHAWASKTIREALLGEGAAANPVILTELMVGDAEPATVAERLNTLGLHLLDLPAGVAHRSAIAYQHYLEQRRQSKSIAAPKMPLPDFFIGAHASMLDLPLATADISRYQTYFPEVKLLAP